ncbi:hypothetical protein PTKIN_Ptkin13bG0037100 [Pterospermum kingtungense]
MSIDVEDLKLLCVMPSELTKDFMLGNRAERGIVRGGQRCGRCDQMLCCETRQRQGFSLECELEAIFSGMALAAAKGWELMIVENSSVAIQEVFEAGGILLRMRISYGQHLGTS